MVSRLCVYSTLSTFQRAPKFTVEPQGPSPVFSFGKELWASCLVHSHLYPGAWHQFPLFSSQQRWAVCHTLTRPTNQSTQVHMKLDFWPQHSAGWGTVLWGAWQVGLSTHWSMPTWCVCNLSLAPLILCSRDFESQTTCCHERNHNAFHELQMYKPMNVRGKDWIILLKHTNTNSNQQDRGSKK